MGIVDINDNVIVEFEYDVILQGDQGVYLAQKGGEWGLIIIDEEYLGSMAPTTTIPDSINSDPAIPKGKYTVKTSGSVLNMRLEADPNSSVVAKIPNGTVLNITKSVTGWAYAKYNSFSGWVSADFLVEYKEPATSAQTATETTVNA